MGLSDGLYSVQKSLAHTGSVKRDYLGEKEEGDRLAYKKGFLAFKGRSSARIIYLFIFIYFI